MKKQIKKNIVSYPSIEESARILKAADSVRDLFLRNNYKPIITGTTEDFTDKDIPPKRDAIHITAERDITLRQDLRQSFMNHIEAHKTTTVPPYKVFHIGSTWKLGDNAISDGYTAHAGILVGENKDKALRAMIGMREHMVNTTDFLLNDIGMSNFVICVSHPALLQLISESIDLKSEAIKGMMERREGIHYHEEAYMRELCLWFEENHQKKGKDGYKPPSELDTLLYNISARVIALMTLLPIDTRSRTVFAPLLIPESTRSNGLFFSIFLDTEKKVAHGATYPVHGGPGNRKTMTAVDIELDIFQIAKHISNKGKLHKTKPEKIPTIVIIVPVKEDMNPSMVAASAIGDGLRLQRLQGTLTVLTEIVSTADEADKLRSQISPAGRIEIGEGEYSLTLEKDTTEVFTDIRKVVDRIVEVFSITQKDSE